MRKLLNSLLLAIVALLGMSRRRDTVAIKKSAPTSPTAAVPAPALPTEGLWVKPDVYRIVANNPVGVLSILPALAEGERIRLGVMHFGPGWEHLVTTADPGQFDRLICCHPHLLPAEWKTKFILDLPWSEMADVNYLMTKVARTDEGRLFCWVEDQFGFVWAANFPYVVAEEIVEGDETAYHNVDFSFETIVIDVEEVEAEAGDETAPHILDLFIVETVSVEDVVEHAETS